MSLGSNVQDLWLFGYGSLIWKPPPHFDKRVPGYVEGYVRRFWQASEDHRGTPEAPGRVVTLITRQHWETLVDRHDSAPARVWGAAYHIPAHHVAEVKAYLDIREINGYSVEYTAFHTPLSSRATLPPSTSSSSSSTTTTTTPPTSSSPSSSSSTLITCLVYIGLPTNPQFLGPQDPETLAAHIARSAGPSGPNSEYVYNLAEALEQVRRDAGGMQGEEDVDDGHVSDLARRVKREEETLRLAGVEKVGRERNAPGDDETVEEVEA